MQTNYISLADDTGYAVAAKEYLDILKRSGATVRWLPMLPGPGLGLSYEPAPVDSSTPGSSLLPYAPTILHTVPEYYPPLVRKLRQEGHTGPFMGMTVWETTRLPKHWPRLLNALDAIIVPTEWNRTVFRDSGVHVPIHVLPHASQFEGHPADNAGLQLLRSRLPSLQGKFVFYSIGTWMRRKANDLLIQAFLKAFPGREDVILILKTSPSDLDPVPSRWRRLVLPQRKQKDWRQIADASHAPQIILLTDHLAPEEIRALHTLGDCFVSLARGEGWGLGSFEAAWYSKPLIVTGFGGHVEFAPPDFAAHVRYNLVPVSVPFNKSYTPDQQWAEPDLEDAVDLLRWTFNNRAEALRRAALLKWNVATHFSSAQIAARLAAILNNGGQ